MAKDVQKDSVREEIPRELYPGLVRAMMRRQAGLSLRIAAIFLTMLFLLPLFNYFWPEYANARVGGFTVSWLFLGVLFYPVTWVLSWYFIRASDRIEAQCADWRSLAKGAPCAVPEEKETVGSDAQ